MQTDIGPRTSFTATADAASAAPPASYQSFSDAQEGPKPGDRDAAPGTLCPSSRFGAWYFTTCSFDTGCINAACLHWGSTMPIKPWFNSNILHNRGWGVCYQDHVLDIELYGSSVAAKPGLRGLGVTV